MKHDSTALLMDLLNALKKLGTTNWKKAGFSMDLWAENKLPETPMLNCGTVCCAYAVGTTLPSWKKAGLGLTPVEGYDPYRYNPTKGARRILELSYEEWEYLFHLVPHYDKVEVGPLDVASHIKKLINRRDECTV